MTDNNLIFKKTFKYVKCETTGDLGFLEFIDQKVINYKEHNNSIKENFYASIDGVGLSHDILEHSLLKNDHIIGSVSNELIAIFLMKQLRDGWYNSFNRYLDIKSDMESMWSEILSSGKELNVIDKFDSKDPKFEEDYKEYSLEYDIEFIKKLNKKMNESDFYYNYDHYLSDCDLSDDIENKKYFITLKRDFLKSCLNAAKIGYYQYYTLFEDLNYDSRYTFNQCSKIIDQAIKELQGNDLLIEDYTNMIFVLTKSEIRLIFNVIDYAYDHDREMEYEKTINKVFRIAIN